MKIAEIYNAEKPVLSLEIFPPKNDYPLSSIFATLDKLTELKPQYISVTYGAAGSTRERTVEIAARIKKEYRIEPQAHLTCVNHNRHEIEGILAELKQEGVMNIMALRGDIPNAAEDFDFSSQDYQYAYQLVEHIRRSDDFGIAAAAHPEGHPDCRRLSEDIEFLRKKVDTGVDFLITQLFFDNRIFYDFCEKAEKSGINCPIIPGIMPILNANQIKRFIYLCGASIPAKLLNIVNKYEKNQGDMEKAGIEYASQQIADLLESKAAGIHLYTMNKADQISRIVHNCHLQG